MGSVVVCGGSVIGLSTAMLLARDGHEVTVIESDPAPVPDLPSDGWDRWVRPGVPQFRQPHNLFSRVRQILDDDLPGITDALLDAGCVWVDPIQALPPSITDRAPRDGDDRFRFVTGRRPVVEATFARAAIQHPRVTVHRGVTVVGLLTGPPARHGIPHVNGVRLANGEDLRADLVVDATGRRTKLAAWLLDVGGSPPTVESEDCGFVYYTRFFEGEARPALIGPPVVSLGTISLLTLAGDNNTWSVTVWAASADTELRVLRDPKRFNTLVRACPFQAHWLDGEPITDMVVMAGILDRYRRFVVDDRPVATGVVAVGDAWACTNPSAGRGLSVGLVHAQRLRDVVREGRLDDPEALVRGFDAVTEADVTPYYRNQIAADRARIAEMDCLREGREPPAPDPIVGAIGATALHDPDVFRGMIEMLTCLALPEDVLARPGFMEKVGAYVGHSPPPVPGPDREQLLGLLS